MKKERRKRKAVEQLWRCCLGGCHGSNTCEQLESSSREVEQLTVLDELQRAQRKHDIEDGLLYHKTEERCQLVLLASVKPLS